MDRRKFLATATVGGLGAALSACAGGGLNLTVDGEDASELAVFTVESIAVPLGYFAAQNVDVDTALRSIYELAVEGTLTVEGINRILKVVGASDPIAVLMVKRAIRLAELAGASVEGGSIVSLANLDPVYVQAIADGYVEGYDTYMLTQAS